MSALFRGINIQRREEILALLLHRGRVFGQQWFQDFRAQCRSAFRFLQRGQQRETSGFICRVFESSEQLGRFQRSGGFQGLGYRDELIVREFGAGKRGSGGIADHYGFG